MTARRSASILAAIVVLLSVVFAALTIADAASVPLPPASADLRR